MSKSVPFWIARRYLFSKSNKNVVNLITGISVVGLTIGTVVLLLFNSIFNGFSEVLSVFYSSFDPDIKVMPNKGKTFVIDSTEMQKILAIEGIETVSKSLEEVAYFEYQGNQTVGILKGVDENFLNVNPLDEYIRYGTFLNKKSKKHEIVFGAGLSNQLNLNIDNKFDKVDIYLPKKKKSILTGQQFNRKKAHPVGLFSIQQQYDTQYAIVDIDFIKKLLKLNNRYSALEIKLQSKNYESTVKKEIINILGDKIILKNRYEQQESFYKVMKMEKWISFAIIFFTSLLIAFNMVGSLWMVVMEKQHNIKIFRAMGMTQKQVGAIFLLEGVWIGVLATGIGVVFSLGFYFLHKTFGIIPVPELFIVDTYPMSLNLFDFIIVPISIMLISVLASVPAAQKAKQLAS